MTADEVRLPHFLEQRLLAIGGVAETDDPDGRVVHPQEERLEPVLLKIAVAVHHSDKLDRRAIRAAPRAVGAADAAVGGAREKLLVLVAEQQAGTLVRSGQLLEQEALQPLVRFRAAAVVHDDQRDARAGADYRRQAALHIFECVVHRNDDRDSHHVARSLRMARSRTKPARSMIVASEDARRVFAAGPAIAAATAGDSTSPAATCLPCMATDSG